MDKGLAFLVLIYVILFIANAILLCVDIQKTWNTPIRAKITSYQWDEEKYAPYRELYYRYSLFENGDSNKHSILLSLERDHRKEAWIKNSTIELNDYKSANIFENILIHEGFFELTYASQDGSEKWHISLIVDHSHYGRQYEIDLNHFGLFYVRILGRFLIYPIISPISIVGLMLNSFTSIGNNVMATGSLFAFFSETLIVGIWLFLLEIGRFLVSLLK